MSSFTYVCLLATSFLAILSKASSITYSTVPDFFLQDLETTNASTFDYTAVNFGLINQTYDTDSPRDLKALTQWQRFDRKLCALNRNAPHNVQYKLLIMGRHGEGWHNAAEDFYGTPAWNCYWSLLDGNGTAIWSDPDLTADGIEEAEIAKHFWQHEFETQKIHAPDSFYVSPLLRSLRTAAITFTGLPLLANSGAPLIPTIKEFLREGISLHTCDRRSNKTYIHSQYPSWRFEPGFAEFDPYWTGVLKETSSGQDARSKNWLDSIFSTDRGVYISITSHSGEIASTLRVLGHQEFRLRTGAVIPVLVKAETELDATPSVTSLPPTLSPHCTVPPVTSISDGACICPNSAPPVTTTLAASGS